MKKKTNPGSNYFVLELIGLGQVLELTITFSPQIGKIERIVATGKKE
jgi:hypothetical protein